VLLQSTVPDFFQEETPDALRSQVDWLGREVSIDSASLAKIVGTDEMTFSNWRLLDTDLPPGGEETLRTLWRTVLHLLSFLNFDESRVRELFLRTMPANSSGNESSVTPPWSGTSLKTYLEQNRTTGIEKVDGWVTGLRFGETYAA
jgi:hypothetical protein